METLIVQARARNRRDQRSTCSKCGWGMVDFGRNKFRCVNSYCPEPSSAREGIYRRPPDPHDH